MPFFVTAKDYLKYFFGEQTGSKSNKLTALQASIQISNFRYTDFCWTFSLLFF